MEKLSKKLKELRQQKLALDIEVAELDDKLAHVDQELIAAEAERQDILLAAAQQNVGLNER